MEGISTMLKLFFKGIVIGVANIMPGAVSYTHLDVYKRQVLNVSPTP